MGHIRFTPQFKNKFKVEGKTIRQKIILKQALETEKQALFQ